MWGMGGRGREGIRRGVLWSELFGLEDMWVGGVSEG